MPELVLTDTIKKVEAIKGKRVITGASGIMINDFHKLASLDDIGKRITINFRW
jgi:YesN/AraC family two-component response regulator